MGLSGSDGWTGQEVGTVELDFSVHPCPGIYQRFPSVEPPCWIAGTVYTLTPTYVPHSRLHTVRNILAPLNVKQELGQDEWLLAGLWSFLDP